LSSPTFQLPAPRLTAARRLPLRAAAIVVLVLVAYNYSLMTLARGLTLQTPLAYLAIVPLLALGLAVARIRIDPPEIDIHDRQVDWIVGIGLLAATGAILVLAPQPESSAFWLGRLDLLTLPIFVAGLVALLFGVRRMWALRVPILFLLLAWPIPFTYLLSVTADAFTEFTARTVGLITAVIPVAHPAVGDETLFLIGSDQGLFGVSIGSACSGMNSFVGFLLLGTALLYLVRGPLVGKVAWLIVGLGVTVGLNVARIMAILVVGHFFGQEAALEVLHPIAGLVVFNIGVLIMIVLVPRFGLRFAGPSNLPAAAEETATPVRRARFALALAVAVAVAFGLTNAAYSRYEAISSGLADARLGAFDIESAHVSGWETSFVSTMAQARQFFGSTATWERVAFQPTVAAELVSSRTVYIDVLTTDDPGTFAAYGLEACYTFHGYRIASVSQVEIGAGVKGQVIDYTNPESGIDWSALWWEWPYTAEDGSTRYERIVVFMADGPQATFRGLPDLDLATQDARFIATDRFLAALGAEIVNTQFEPGSSS